jgi:hypothetical protein
VRPSQRACATCAQVYGLLWILHSPVTCASRRTFRRMTAIGTASNHGLTHLATRCLEFTAGVAEVFSCRVRSFHDVRFRFARLIADRFFSMSKGHERKNQRNRSDNSSHGLLSRSQRVASIVAAQWPANQCASPPTPTRYLEKAVWRFRRTSRVRSPAARARAACSSAPCRSPSCRWPRSPRRCAGSAARGNWRSAPCTRR